ncbi:MAG TPA: SDR family oxidoreductase [Bacillota bacterium]|nr:SDR family oxidoreductase [Bacillota bacterium]
MKNIVITGGSDGIGRAVAEHLAREHHVIVIARNVASLEQIAAENGCAYAACDVRDPKQVTKTIAGIVAQHGPIDVLINNAGIIVNDSLVDTSYEDIENVICTNTLGAIYVAKAALTSMKEYGKGYIINVNSQSGINARAGRSIYNASKWAITGFTKALQQEANQYNVRVTGLYPGAVRTGLFAKAGIEIKAEALETDQIVQAIDYLVSLDEHVLVPEFGIKHING